MNDDIYFLLDTKMVNPMIYGEKLFKALFYVPGIKFVLGMQSHAFPEIPAKYIGIRGQIEEQSYTIVCYTNPAHLLRLNGYLARTHCLGDTCYLNPAYMLKYSRIMGSSHNDDCCNISIHWSIASEKGSAINLSQFMTDGDFSCEQTYPIIEYLLGPSWRPILDDSMFTIQKNRFINKYAQKKLIIEQIECFSVAKYALISVLINLELPDEVTHINIFQ